ncbi:efflux RND transporter periplasmic adaptor subunit [Oceanibium sediminis]|uniref:efflux RND transporter periplasmic adaptor subunit n=1 Tax=Oceanibium sediminis TaxID=2026339 RepID=UPI000DD35C13|nr:HlyD family efflux transporter periplasmic adaptor subunit [Oceanibium sediminis]
MRFLTRSLAGILLLCLTLGLLALAGNTLYSSMADRGGDERRRGPAQERVFTVNVARITPGTATPRITAFGDVASRRTLDIRAAVSGRIVDIAEAFRDGGRVSQGDVLLRIDPSDARATLDLARAELAEAEASAREAATRATLAREDLAAAEQTERLRQAALARQRDLQDRGAGTGAAVETAEIAVANAAQSVVGRRQALAQAESQRDLAAIAVERRQIAVREAQRALDETVITAPFDGLLTAASAIEGGIVNTNERIGGLIDTSALEVSFRVSNAQYARLLGPGGALRPVPVEATLPLDDFPITVSGTVDRAGAQVGEGQTGRLLYARLDTRTAGALRPGDFLTVVITEPRLENVAIIPSTAANNAGEVLLLGEDDRLEAGQVTILRRQGNDLIVRGLPEGRELVLERAPQIGPGVKVRPIRRGASGETAPLSETSENLALAPDRRARLIAYVEGNARMPADVKQRLLAQLNAEQVPSAVVERLESRMGG